MIPYCRHVGARSRTILTRRTRLPSCSKALVVFAKGQETSFASLARAQQKHINSQHFQTNEQVILDNHELCQKRQQFDKSLREVESEVLHHVTPNAKSVDSLALWLEKGKLNLYPKYQRKYVWKADKASRLVVTALCGRIIPAVTMHEVSKGRYDMVDGKQRLSTLLAFYLAGEKPVLYETLVREDKLPDFEKLDGLDENYEVLKGLSYAMLSEARQDAYSSFNIPVTTIPLNTPKKDIFSCYEDINSGGEDLTAHQIRRVVHGGRYIDMLEELVLNETFQMARDPVKVAAGEYEEDKDEFDRELILRAFAFDRNYVQYKNPIKHFLNDEVDYVNCLDDKKQLAELQKLRDQFEFTIKIWRNVFSGTDGVFRAWTERKESKNWHWKTSKYKGTSISVPLWDAMYSVTGELRTRFPNPQMYTKCRDKLIRAIQEMFEMNPSVFMGHATAKKFAERKDLLQRTLAPVLRKANPQQGGRSFRDDGGQLKEELFAKQRGKCTICAQTLDVNRILDGKYAHIDHIEPYSKGGATVKSNAALVHAECNLTKSAKTL